MRLTLASALLLIALVSGCSRPADTAKDSKDSARTDARLAGDVQVRISSDPTLAGRSISINANRGAITLSGQVADDAELYAALNDAQQVEGVRQVISRLQLEAAQLESEPAARPAYAARKRAIIPARHTSYPQTRTPDPIPSPLLAAATRAPESSVAESVPPRVTEVARVTIPAGTELHVRTIDSLNSETSRADQTFHGTIDSDVIVDDRTVIPAGADIQGRVVEVHASTHYTGGALLTLQLTKLEYAGKNYTVSTEQWTRKADARGKNTAAKVGTGAAVGAVLGGIFGGGRGAAIAPLPARAQAPAPTPSPKASRSRSRPSR